MPSLILLDLTLGDVLADIPHDTGALVVYLMMALFVGLIVGGNIRSSARARGSGEPEDGPPPSGARRS